MRAPAPSARSRPVPAWAGRRRSARFRSRSGRRLAQGSLRSRLRRILGKRGARITMRHGLDAGRRRGAPPRGPPRRGGAGRGPREAGDAAVPRARVRAGRRAPGAAAGRAGGRPRRGEVAAAGGGDRGDDARCRRGQRARLAGGRRRPCGGARGRPRRCRARARTGGLGRARPTAAPGRGDDGVGGYIRRTGPPRGADPGGAPRDDGARPRGRGRGRHSSPPARARRPRPCRLRRRRRRHGRRARERRRRPRRVPRRRAADEHRLRLGARWADSAQRDARLLRHGPGRRRHRRRYRRRHRRGTDREAVGVSRIAYLDCIGGIAGDMLLAALLDCGAPAERLAEVPALLGVDARVEVTRVSRHGIGALHVDVTAAATRTHTAYGELRERIERSALPARARARSLDAFARLAAVESRIHGVPPDEVVLHELGAVDTLVDVCGAMTMLDELGVERVVCSPLPFSRGLIDAAHGVLPVPAPAALALLVGAPLAGVDAEDELVTPTGAAVAATVAASWGLLPPLTLDAVGYGAGTRDLRDRPNVLRVLVGEASATAIEPDVVLLETNLDDLNPQLVPDAVE